MSIDGIGTRIGSGPSAAHAATGRPPQKELKAPDAELRSVLSPDELAYFAELERMGPVTYGPRASQRAEAPPPVLGQRIDVRA